MKINFLKIRYVALILLSIFMFFSCSYGLDEFFYRDGVVNSRARSLLSLPSSEVPEVPSDADYDFWLITDVHFGGEHGKKTGERKDQQFIQKIMDLPQSKRPYFIVCLGDVAEHGKPGEYRNYRKFTDQIAEIPNPLGNPIVTYSIVGNHDLYNSGWESYRKYVYPNTSFYVFQTHGISWYFIDSGSGSLGKKQFSKLKAAMKNDSNKKFVFSHFPIYADGLFYFTMQDTTERNLLISLCAKNDVIRFFDGHTHEKHENRLGSFIENNLPGYLEDRSWAVVTVNESSFSSRIKVVTLD